MRNPSSAAAPPPRGNDRRHGESRPDSGPPSGDFPEVQGFEILGWAGSGGMGEVWRALQVAEQRIVAVKILRAPAGAPARQAMIAERFKREIAVAAQFDHPALTRVLGSGATSLGQAYVVMEWIEGLPLDEFVSTRPLPLAQRIGLGVAIARAVQQLHERGCIHRDLKPGNILVTEAGEPRILDFGLARPLDAMELGPTVSLEGDLIGTPHFMSPEQAAGDSTRVGTRSDVWSLGLLLFYLVSGQWPWPAALPAADVLQKILTTDPPRLRRLAPDTPSDLEAIVMHCLSRDPAQRYDGAGAVAEDLSRWQRGEPVTARAATVRYLLGNALRRHRRLTSAVAGVLTAALAAVIWHQHVQAKTNHLLQLALDEATSLRSYLLFDLRWNLDSTGREDILDAAVRRAEEFPATLAAADLPPGPKFDPRRFEALAANLRGQALAFRGNLAGALETCLKEHTLNQSLLAAWPGDQQTTLNVVASALGAAGLLLRLEQPEGIRPLLEPVLTHVTSLESSTPIPASTLLADHLQLLILLSRADRALAESRHPVRSRILRFETDKVVRPPDSKHFPPPIAEALALLPRFQLAGGTSVLLTAAVHSEAAEWAMAAGDGERARQLFKMAMAQLEQAITKHPEEAPLKGAIALCRKDLAQACLTMHALDEAWVELQKAGDSLESMRKEGYFDPSMWRERAVARIAQDLAEAFLARNQGILANQALHLSARMMQVRVHRPVALQLPAADLARQNWLTGRLREAAGDVNGAALSFRRAFDALEKCISADPDNPVWLLDFVEAGIRLQRILVSKPRADLAYTADHVGSQIAAAQNKATTHPKLTPELRDRINGFTPLRQ